MTTFKVVALTPDLVPGAITVLRDSFFPNEKVCTCVNLLQDSPQVSIDAPYKCTEASLELEKLALDNIKDNVSVAAVDSRTNEVLGVAINKIQVKPSPGEPSYFESFIKNMRDPSALALMHFMIEVDARTDLFQHFKSTCCMELVFLAVKDSAKGRGIGQALVKETIETMIKYKGSHKPTFLSAIFTSRFSQKAGLRAEMEAILEVPYTEFEYNGRKYSDVTGQDHPSSLLCAKAVE